MFSATHRFQNRISLRSGLSLLELLVVLTILIALGGIVVSTLPGILQRTQVATAAANVPEIDASIRRNAMLAKGQIGNRFDSLIAGTGALDGEVVSYLGGYEDLQTATLSSADLVALSELGIVELVPALDQPENATFGSHIQEPVALAADSNVCVLSPDSSFELLRNHWNFEPLETAKYVLLGIGERCTLVGAGTQAVFSEAPVHFSDNSNHSPQDMYSRYLILVEINQSNETTASARYIGVAIPGIDGIHSVAKELNQYYSD